METKKSKEGNYFLNCYLSGWNEDTRMIRKNV